MKPLALVLLSISLVGIGGCREPEPQAVVDMAALRAEMQEHTETLLLIHFKLDNALEELAAAEMRAEEGGCATAGYHAADAYREVQAADEQLLDLGRNLQATIGLDTAAANRN